MPSLRYLKLNPLILSQGFGFAVNGATYFPPSVGYFLVVPQYIGTFLTSRFQIPVLLQILSGAASAQGPYTEHLTSIPLTAESRPDAQGICNFPPSQQGHPGYPSRRHDFRRDASRCSGTLMPLDLNRRNAHVQSEASNSLAWREYFA